MEAIPTVLISAVVAARVLDAPFDVLGSAKVMGELAEVHDMAEVFDIT